MSSVAAFYVVHPTFFLKVSFTLLSAFMSSAFNDKLRYLDGLTELFAMYPRAALQLPDDVLKEDSLITGKRWTDERSTGI